jgi:hypothetical protein
MSDNITNEKQRNVGFKVVSDHEYNILQQYADIFAQQEIEDPITKQRRKLLAKNSISLLFKMLLIHTA